MTRVVEAASIFGGFGGAFALFFTVYMYQRTQAQRDIAQNLADKTADRANAFARGFGRCISVAKEAMGDRLTSDDVRYLRAQAQTLRSDPTAIGGDQ